MAAWRRADVDEIKRFAGQQVVYVSIPATAGTRLQKGCASLRDGVGCRYNSNVIPGLPAGQVPQSGNVSEANKCSSQHALPQSSPNWREMAANDSSRISMPRKASSSLITNGGLIRMTCEYDMVMSPRSSASWKRARVMP